MALTPNQLKSLRAQAHALKPVVMVGQQGLKHTIIEEINQALDFHELIKVKIAADREEREQISRLIADQTKAQVVQQVGQITVLFRRNKQKPKIVLPSR